MANFSFDVSLGREVEFHYRVNDNDPANAVFTLVVLAHEDLDPDSILRTYSTLSAIASGGNIEVGNTNYARIELSDVDIVSASTDTTLHKTTIGFFPVQFTSIGAGDIWSKLLLCYDPDSTAGNDANIIPVCAFDLRKDGVPVTPNGNHITISAPDGYLIAR